MGFLRKTGEHFRILSCLIFCHIPLLRVFIWFLGGLLFCLFFFCLGVVSCDLYLFVMLKSS